VNFVSLLFFDIIRWDSWSLGYWDGAVNLGDSKDCSVIYLSTQ